MYKYRITGYYFINGDKENRFYFDEEVEAKNNSDAMEMVLGKIWWKENRNDNTVGLDVIHYEVLRG